MKSKMKKYRKTIIAFLCRDEMRFHRLVFSPIKSTFVSQLNGCFPSPFSDYISCHFFVLPEACPNTSLTLFYINSAESTAFFSNEF